MNEIKIHRKWMIIRKIKYKNVRRNGETQNLEERLRETEALYREIISSLLYLPELKKESLNKPGIAHAVNYLSRRQINALEKD